MKPRWPGLLFWLGSSFFRTLGYGFLVLAGVCIALHDPFYVFIGEIAFGHLFICAAEVIDDTDKLSATITGSNEAKRL